MVPFELAIADSQLDDLRRRLESARWPVEYQIVVGITAPSRHF